MGLNVRKPGILTTVQDLGRAGARKFGVNPAGVMDTVAARTINIILGNDNAAAVLEMHFPAAEIEFDADTTFAIGGADFDAKLDGVPVRNWSTAFGKKGSVLKFGRKNFGSRAYLAVKGGIAVDEWLGSSSTNLIARIGGFAGRKLAAGDRIECESSGELKTLAVGPSILPRYSRFPTVRAVAGAEFASLTAASERLFVNAGFTLTNSCDRMGYRMSGKPLRLRRSREMVSAGVSFGTIQLLPDGQLIVLMADHQTSGGYPRIANVVSTDLPVLAQLGPGDGVSFQLVSIEEAEQLVTKFETELKFLRAGCRLQTRC